MTKDELIELIKTLNVDEALVCQSLLELPPRMQANCLKVFNVARQHMPLLLEITEDNMKIIQEQQAPKEPPIQIPGFRIVDINKPQGNA